MTYDPRETIINAMTYNYCYTYEDIAKYSGLSIRTVRQYIGAMRHRGVIIEKDKNMGGRYTIMKKSPKDVDARDAKRAIRVIKEYCNSHKCECIGKSSKLPPCRIEEWCNASTEQMPNAWEVK